MRPTYLTVGVFDGVHRGHQALLSRLVTRAREDRARSAVLTFFPHPITVVRGSHGRIYLCQLEERLRLIREQGVELIIAQTFDESVRQTRAADFVHQLVVKLDLRQLWGGGFSLGHNREGTATFLREIGGQLGFTVHEFNDLVMLNGERVSSSRIRRSLAAGDVTVASECLGRPYRVEGMVVPGDRRGRQIGFPTANLAVWEEQVLPVNGVYATYAWIGGRQYAAATNIGVRPTVDGTALTVETHVLDYTGDLYGQTLALEFIDHVRDEHRFPSLEALVAQIRADVTAVRALLLPMREGSER